MDEVKYAVINKIEAVSNEKKKVMVVGVKSKIYERSEWNLLKQLVRGKASY